MDLYRINYIFRSDAGTGTGTGAVCQAWAIALLTGVTIANQDARTRVVTTVWISVSSEMSVFGADVPE